VIHVATVVTGFAIQQFAAVAVVVFDRNTESGLGPRTLGIGNDQYQVVDYTVIGKSMDLDYTSEPELVKLQILQSAKVLRRMFLGLNILKIVS